MDIQVSLSKNLNLWMFSKTILSHLHHYLFYVVASSMTMWPFNPYKKMAPCLSLTLLTMWRSIMDSLKLLLFRNISILQIRCWKYLIDFLSPHQFAFTTSLPHFQIKESKELWNKKNKLKKNTLKLYLKAKRQHMERWTQNQKI